MISLAEKDLEAPTIDINLLSEQEKTELINADAVSITSGTTTAATIKSSSSSSVSTIVTPNKPKRSLFIYTKGIPLLRLPAPSSELQICIYNNAPNDGDEGNLAFTSTRTKRSSGNCVLTAAGHSLETQQRGSIAIETEYFFGPGRDPVLHVLDTALPEGKQQMDIKTTSKWTSRSQTFALSDGRSFTWAYKKSHSVFGSSEKDGKDNSTALVMTLDDGKVIAALIRNKDTRTPGSKSCSAGNGGELVLMEGIGSSEGVSEELIVASCLLMLKKEMDRRRMVQAMMISAAVTA